MRRLALVLATVLPLTLAACGDSSGPGGAATGTYTLRSIDGDPVPVLVEDDGFSREEITGGFVRLNANGTFSASHTRRITTSSSVTTDTEDITGTFTRTGANVTLTFGDPDGVGTVSFDAVWGEDLLTVFDTDGTIWLYQR
jgi:hypothetical protein